MELGKGRDISEKFIFYFMVRYGLVDGGREVRSRVDGFIWRNFRGIVRRLDYVFLVKFLSLLVGRLFFVFFLDYDGLLLEVCSCVLGFGFGYWRLNISIFEEELFK